MPAPVGSGNYCINNAAITMGAERDKGGNSEVEGSAMFPTLASPTVWTDAGG